jgi:hypothetical protein
MSLCVENLSAPSELFTPFFNLYQYSVSPQVRLSYAESVSRFPAINVSAVSSLCTATIEQATRSTAASSNPPGAALRGRRLRVDGLFYSRGDA